MRISGRSRSKLPSIRIFEGFACLAPSGTALQISEFAARLAREVKNRSYFASSASARAKTPTVWDKVNTASAIFCAPSSFVA